MYIIGSEYLVNVGVFASAYVCACMCAHACGRVYGIMCATVNMVIVQVLMVYCLSTDAR